MATPARILAAANTPKTPEWWVKKLAEKHSLRLPTLRKYLNYYDGDQDLSFATERFREHFAGLLKELSVNICGVIVQAMVERMKVQGISIPVNRDDPTKPQRAYDEEAWAMWQRNGLDAASGEHHTQTATTGYGYMTVWGDANDQAVITVEDPLQMIVAYTAETPRRRAAALKRWIDEWTGYEFATLYLPEAIYRFRSLTPAAEVAGMFQSVTDVDWIPRGDEFTSVVENPLGVVPVVEFANDPTVRGEGRSELSSIIPIQDAINKEVCDMIVASEFAAYPQRVLIGVEPVVDKDGKPQAPFKSMDSVWALGNKDAKAMQFAAADLTNYTKAKESLLQDAAFISRTPRHYFTQSGQSPSGDALKSSETGLVAKVKDREVPHSESYEEVTRLAYLVEGNKEKAAVWDSEVKWADPEYRTEGELTDAVIKQYQTGLIPWEYAVDKLGYSPQDIEAMRRMRVRDALTTQGTNIASLLPKEPETAE